MQYLFKSCRNLLFFTPNHNVRGGAFPVCPEPSSWSSKLGNGYRARYPLPSFELQLEGSGHTGNAPPLTLWLGVKNNKFLHDLNRYCISAAKRAGINPDMRDYKPHVTLGYLGAITPLERVMSFEKRTSRFNSAPFLIDEMILYSSHRRSNNNNLYKMEATYPMLLS